MCLKSKFSILLNHKTMIMGKTRLQRQINSEKSKYNQTKDKQKFSSSSIQVSLTKYSLSTTVPFRADKKMTYQFPGWR